MGKHYGTHGADLEAYGVPKPNLKSRPWRTTCGIYSSTLAHTLGSLTEEALASSFFDHLGFGFVRECKDWQSQHSRLDSTNSFSMLLSPYWR